MIRLIILIGMVVFLSCAEDKTKKSADRICACLEELQKTSDSVRFRIDIVNCISLHYYDFEKHQNSIPEDLREYEQNVIEKLATECSAYGEQMGEYIELTKKPSNINFSDSLSCLGLKTGVFRSTSGYKNVIGFVNGDTSYTYHYMIGTITKSLVRNISPCQFDYQFVESNDPLINEMNQKGEYTRQVVLNIDNDLVLNEFDYQGTHFIQQSVRIADFESMDKIEELLIELRNE